MYWEEGILSFYWGTFINLLGNTVSNILFFTIYADGKKRYNYSRENSSLFDTVFISMRAGVFTMLITNPIWVLKTRTMLHLNERSQKISGYKLTKEILSDMLSKEGTKALFWGYPISIFLSLYGMISMSIYETVLKAFDYTE